jgi:hypothetical protein
MMVYPITHDGYENYGTFGVDSSVYPLVATGANSLLLDADPCLYWLLDFAYSMLQVYAQPRWAIEIQRAGLTAYPNICSLRVPYSPFPFLQDTAGQSGLSFPLLSLNRVEGQSKELTRVYQRTESTLEFNYVLPPFTAAQTQIAGPILNAVLSIIRDRFEYGFDPNYMSGATIGSLAQFDNLWLEEYSLGMMPGKSNLPMQTLTMKIKLRERNMGVTGAFGPLTGFTYNSSSLSPSGSATGPAFYYPTGP